MVALEASLRETTAAAEQAEASAAASADKLSKQTRAASDAAAQKQAQIDEVRPGPQRTGRVT